MAQQGFHGPGLPAAYFNDMSNQELYSAIPAAGLYVIPAVDPQNLTEEFHCRVRERQARPAQFVSNGPAQEIVQVIPQYPFEAQRLLDVVKEEMRCFNALEEDRCPPWYPKSQVAHVVHHPEDVPDITSPWKGECDDGARVLSKQLYYWRRFRSWQIDRRERLTLFDIERESRAHLQRHGIQIPRDFELDELPSHQDQAMEWLEFLDFVGRERSVLQRRLKECQRLHEFHWHKVRNSGQLAGDTTEEDVVAQREDRLAWFRARRHEVTTAANADPEWATKRVSELDRQSNILEEYYAGVDILHRAKRFHGQMAAIWDWAVAHLFRLVPKRGQQVQLQADIGDGAVAQTASAGYRENSGASRRFQPPLPPSACSSPAAESPSSPENPAPTRGQTWLAMMTHPSDPRGERGSRCVG
ncbi:uncharacterized protein MAM_03182 [Metarhizium album ARSEF 1941]|uniref:Uncharacterized protein n=1 Tax=Metarhizium album (strain ARSEF 1941) TaxID=1081103 RepID=A0A0B2X0W6_METAS|nr:uncharacterized protein MAM_03182 [Metarhizium album ARSEF 1941]KHN98720.1 hypothetical protein MAM_03182 [Metarhizium album ARSEF 1941]